jgi:hydrophobe/amphiphile efflux-1 (HAE1) family protein
VRLDIAYDNTQYVRQSLREVTETILIAFVLVVLVVFAFLREWRTTLIPVLAIPVSIVGTFAIIYLCGFSINTLTLLGLVLAIGIVVDDAIVVLENIYAKVEDGMSPLRAGIAGTKEIFFAVISTTITLLVVFLPLLFMSGMSGRLFREFGVTIAGAVLISALVALTLTPMLSARLLKAGHAHGRLFEHTEPFFRAMERGYAHSLASFLRHRWLAPVIALAAGALGYVLFTTLPRELSPMEDRGRISLRATAAEGVGYDYMLAFMDDLTNLAADAVPEAAYMITQTPVSGGGGGVQGPANTGSLRIFLSDKSERARSQSQIAAELQEHVRALGGARVKVTQEASIGERSANETGVRFVVQAPTLEMLRDVLPNFLEHARQSPVFSFVDSDLTFTKPEVRLTIERDKAQALGVSTLDIAQTLQASLSGQRFGYFIYNGRQYDVIGQLTRDFRSRPQDLANIAVHTPTGGIVRLDNVVTIVESSAPPELFRYNRYNAATVSGTLAPGRTMDEGIAAFDEVARATLDERFTTSLSGAAKDFVDSAASLLWVFVLALLLIYLVLAAQFESFLDPLVILLTVPLAIGGALATLWMFDQTLNIFSQIGLIMLIGLVTKNGILIVEFANQRLDAGAASPLVAIQEASAARLRPILMTTLAMTLGILPIALALGAGAESRVSMGIAVIGGLLTSGGLTLYVIPATYLLLSRRDEVGEEISTASDFSRRMNRTGDAA